MIPTSSFAPHLSGQSSLHSQNRVGQPSEVNQPFLLDFGGSGSQKLLAQALSATFGSGGMSTGTAAGFLSQPTFWLVAGAVAIIGVLAYASRHKH